MMSSRLRFGSRVVRRVIAVLLCFGLALPAALEARADPARLRSARGFYKRGKAAFELGKFKLALESYEEAYRLAALPGLLFNIGQCYRNLGHLEKAVFSFRLYLRKVPRARNKEATKSLIVELDREIEKQRVEAEARRLEDERHRRAEARREAARRRRLRRRRRRNQPFYKKWWFWTIVGVAVAGGVGTGVYFGTRSSGPDLPSSPFPPWELP